MTVGIVGLGLMGGSMAKSIKTRTDHVVYGIDLDDETMLLARLSGAIDGTLSDETLPLCDLIILAIRPAAAIHWTEENAAKISTKAIVVDFCGVKRSVVEKLAPLSIKHGFSYVGGHPMAGKERGGFTSSSEDLYVGASMILTPDENTDIELLESLKKFFIDTGFANLTFSTPEEHDKIIAYTSQLAHIASSAYIKSPTAQKRYGFSAGSFRDMTRVARLDEDMWTELFMEDSDYLTEELKILIANLNEYLKAIETKDKEMLRALLRDGREKKSTAGGN